VSDALDLYAEYNPLDYRNLTVNLVRELLSRPAGRLPPDKAFPGAGVYAIFYHGRFAPYQSITESELQQPIYVGKAIPSGGRKGSASGSLAAGQPLYHRLRQHASSIDAAKNIELRDFSCRYLVVTPLWITMAERFLIENFQPVWNVCIEGFGIHDPGSGRYEGEVSWWDALHPGRSWANKVRQTRTQADAERRLADWFNLRAADPHRARAIAEQAESDDE
jgi:Eco29kI-like restriction endonuclease